MNIGFYIPQIFGGGAERVVATISNHLVKMGHYVVVITTTKNENEYLLADGIKRYVLSEMIASRFSILRKVQVLVRLRTIAKVEKLSVLVGFMGGAIYYTIFSMLALSTKSIISVRNDPNMLYSTAVSRFFAKLLFPLADGCIFQTEDAKSWFPVALQNKSQIIYNPIGEQFFETIHKPEDDLVITAGRLLPQKNHRMLVDAFKVVHMSRPSAKLHIYGEGFLKDTLESYIMQLGLEKVISLKGATSSMPEVLSFASLFVLSSDVEGAPNALMEAMAVGVPPISTDCPCGGPKMLISSDEYGRLVGVNDKDALASRILELLNDRDKRIAISQNVKAYANRFKVTTVTEKWVEYFNKISNV